MSELGGGNGQGPYVLCCPDKFREALSAAQAADALCAGVREGGVAARSHPVADGGEGTLDALVRSGRAMTRGLTTVDAMARPRRARLALIGDEAALVESAQAVGLGSLPGHERDPMRSSTAGVGRMIRAALRLGMRRVIVAVGGTATIDGGLGAIRELGARLLDARGNELAGCGADLLRVAKIDASRLEAGSPGMLEFALDAWCPLSGPDGTARVFGPQKGASNGQIEALDRALGAYGERLGLAAQDARRLGTGGGLAAPFVALNAARVRSGAELVLAETGFEKTLSDAALCVTGEGRVDYQSTLGKTVMTVARTARAHEVPVVVVGGAIEGQAAALYEAGAAAILPIGLEPRPVAESCGMAEADLRWIGRALAGLVRPIAGTAEPRAAARGP